MKPMAFLHPGNIGDCWASIPAMREYHRSSGRKIILYLVRDQNASYYEGATHPTKNKDGVNVMLNKKMIDMMIPLLREQPFIELAKAWEEEPFEVDLGNIRDTEVGMPGFSINRWYFYVWPDLACDLSGKWLEVPDAEKDFAKGKILITRSERYLNETISYNFLKPYEDEILFAGTMREYNVFCMGHDLNIRKLNVSNFLELAQAIKQCKFHITNQTQAFQLSEGQKTPRILEVCRFAPNCIPIGKDAYDFFAQVGLEYYFHKLLGEEKEYITELKKEMSISK